MSTPENEPVVRSKIAALKEAVLRFHRRVYWALGAWLIAGVLVGLGTWFIQKPMDRDSIMLGGVLGLGLATFFIGGFLTRILFPKPDTKCPQCGYDWKLSEEYPNNMLTWKCCPGCGLNMRDDTGSHEKP